MVGILDFYLSLQNGYFIGGDFMKKRYLTVLISMVIIFLVYALISKSYNSNLKIEELDEDIIFDYLDNKTDNIAYSNKGKMYSSYKILGIEGRKIYIWMTKVEYLIVDNQIIHEGGDSVSLPMVLKVRKKDNNNLITHHKYPKDGIGYSESIKKLFPDYIQFPDNEELLELNLLTKIRAEEDFHNGIFK